MCGAAHPEVAQALAHWPVGEPRTWSQVTGGLIHETFRVETDQGAFCLQALHPALSSPEILADWQAVLEHLARRGFPAPRLVSARDGRATVSLDGRVWRLTTWLEGRSIENVSGPKPARQSARLFARFYEAMSGFPLPFQSSHPLHDWEHHAAALQQAQASSERVPDPWPSQVAELAPLVLDGIRRNALTHSLPLRVVHGDPKISNVLFDTQGRACGLVDLDTCCRHTILVDLGDALRSWTMDGPEDACTGFRRDVFLAALEGWAAGGLRLTELELLELAKAPALISFELAARFLRDVLEDRYFGYDSSRYPSRRHHNLARARAMARLGAAFEEERDWMASQAAVLGKG